MSLYEITGYDQTGRPVRLSSEGPSEREVIDKARSLGIFASRIRRLDASGRHASSLATWYPRIGALALGLIALAASDKFSLLMDSSRSETSSVAAGADARPNAIPETHPPRITHITVEQQSYENITWVNLDLDISMLPTTYAVKSELHIADRSDQVELRSPGKKNLRFELDPGVDSHQPVPVTESGKMNATFVVQQVLVKGGSSHTSSGFRRQMSGFIFQPKTDIGVYKFKAGAVAHYKFDINASQRVESIVVGEAGSETVEDTSRIWRIDFTQKVLHVDQENVATLEFTYDKVTQKQTIGAREQLIDTSGMTGRRFTAQVSDQGKILNVDAAGDPEEFKTLLESLFVTYPDQPLQPGEEWEDERQSQSTDPASGLQLAQTNALTYKMLGRQAFQGQDSLLIDVVETIEQRLHVRTDGPYDKLSTNGQGTGRGRARGTIRVDAKSGQLLALEQSSTLSNLLIVDEQLAGATIRTNFTTELTTTTNLTAQ